MTTQVPTRQDKIIVKCRDSLLTTTSGYTNYRGILNLAIILLVLSNARAALENLIKYGILVDPISWFSFFAEGSKHWPSLMISLSLAVHVCIALALERLIAWVHFRRRELMSPKQAGSPNAKKSASASSNTNNGSPTNKITSSSAGSVSKKMKSFKDARSALDFKLAGSIHLLASIGLNINLFACIALPPAAIYTHDTHPISTSASLMLVSIVFLKLVSYHMMNFWCRDVTLPEQEQSNTTKSFLRSYVPPAVEFGVQKVETEMPSPVVGATSGSKVSITPNGKFNSSVDSQSANEIRKRNVLTDQNSNTSENNNTIDRENSLSNKDQTATPKSCPGNKDTQSPTKNHNQTDSHRREWLRSKLKEESLRSLSKYPENLTTSDMFAFMLFPTLCYEVEFARTDRIRKRFLIKRIIELIILIQVDMALVQQWIIPIVSNSMLPLKQMQLSHMLERLLKLAIPNHVIWLIWFYLFFHSFLNIVAELTCFADREFYRDWWNSESVNYFWSNWNIPVHKWCARHLYVPLISLGLSRCQASTAVFFVSAFFHEYLVSVPLKMFRMWAFTGMLIQLPWARFVSSQFNNNLANVAVWVSLIIGQPLCILMYYHDYYVINEM